MLRSWASCWALLGLLLAALWLPMGADASSADQAEVSASGEIVVRLQAGRDARALAGAHGADVLGSIRGTDLSLLKVRDPRSAGDVLRALQADGRNVAFAEPNARFSLGIAQVELPGLDQVDLPGLDQVVLPGLDQVILPGLDGTEKARLDRALGAWRGQAAYRLIGVPAANTRATGRGVTIAVLDGGADQRHPLFSWLWREEQRARGSHGGWSSQGPLDLVGDTSGPGSSALAHGTFVAGQIAGVAPGATLLPIRVADAQGQSTAFRIAAGIAAGVERGADVINVSLSTPDRTPRSLQEAMDAARQRGVLVVASAGNRGARGADFPARLGFGVGATGLDDRRAPFSNFGTGVDLAAPGVGLVGPISANGRRTTASWSGTSFAAAITSGAAALVRERQDERGSELGEALVESATRLRGPDGLRRRLDAAAAIRED